MTVDDAAHRRRDIAGVHHPVPGLYSQVVACADGPRFEFSSILPYDEDGDLDGDIVVQAVVLVENIRRALVETDLLPTDVVRIQVQAANLDDFVTSGAIGQVFGFFGEERPAASIVQARMVNPEVLIQVDLSAVRAPRA